MSEERLTPKQARFVIEYLFDLNATQAAIRAGYSEDTAQEQGSRLLSNVMVSKAIDEQLEARTTRTLITADKVLHEMFSLANVDVNDAFDENGDLKPLKDIPINVRKAIASIEVDAIYANEPDPNNEGKKRKVQIGVTRKVKFWDKGKAQENLAKHLKLITDRMELANSDGTNLQFPTMATVFVKCPNDVPKEE